MYGWSIAIGGPDRHAIAQRRWARRGGDPDDIASIAFGAVLAAWSAPASTTSSPTATVRGPLVARGGGVGGRLGIPGGLLAGVPGRRVAGPAPRPAAVQLMDVAAPAIPVAQAIGRLGNWFNQELFAAPPTCPGPVHRPRSYRPPGYASVATYHPTFLYEALWNLALAGALVLYERAGPASVPATVRPLRRGYAAAGCGSSRCGSTPPPNVLGLRVNLWVSGLALLAAGAWLLRTPPIGPRAVDAKSRAGRPTAQPPSGEAR